MAENHHDAHFHMWGRNSNAYNLYIVRKEILSGLIVLRTRIQKWTYFELLIENRRDIFLKVVGFFLKNLQDMKKLQQLFN